VTAVASGLVTGELALEDFRTASGRELAGLRLRYRVLGNPESARQHGWMLIFHALTGSAEDHHHHSRTDLAFPP
jgi:homoserine acetyltransferase